MTETNSSDLSNDELVERYKNLYRFYQSEESRDKGYNFDKCREIKGKLDDTKALLELRGYRVEGVSVSST